jgi:TRAP-type mannitol/chloroaromatic compound transport system substrate-binding protein
MKRREFIKKASVSTVAASTVTLTGTKISKADTVFKWKLVTAWPKNFPGLGHGANLLAQMITEMSGGRINVKVYGASELVPAFEVFDAVANGTAEMGHSGSYYLKGKSEAAQFFSAVPFGFTAQ